MKYFTLGLFIPTAFMVWMNHWQINIDVAESNRIRREKQMMKPEHYLRTPFISHISTYSFNGMDIVVMATGPVDLTRIFEK